MKKIEAIIMTNSTYDAIQLHNHMGDEKFEAALKRPVNQYPIDWKFYDKLWFWWFDENGKLSGNSGHSALETAVRLSPGSRIYHLEDFLKTSLK